MLDLARANAAQAGATNVEFIEGTIEEVPLPDGAVDVVISNCVINLSVDKPKVIAEMFRVLAPGGRIGISDVVAEDRFSPAERAERGSYVGCIAGALSRTEYLQAGRPPGSSTPSVRFTHQVADGMHDAIIQASKPGGTGQHPQAAATAAAAGSTAAAGGTGGQPRASACCDTSTASTCCAAEAKASCCGDTRTGQPASCGCR